MRINSQNIINDLITKDTASPILRVGNVYNMDLLEFDMQTATLKYNGHEIQGKLEANNGFLPETGATIQVKVESFNNNEIVLKLINPLENFENMYTQEDMRKILMNQGFLTTKDNVSIVEKLLLNKLPLTKENIQTLQQSLKYFPHNKNVGIDTAIFLIKRHLPIQPFLINLISKYIDQKRLIGKNIKDLMNNLNSSSNNEQDINSIKENLKEFILVYKKDFSDTENLEKMSQEIMKTIMKYKNSSINKKSYYESMKEIFSSYKIKWDDSIKNFMQNIFLQGIINRSEDEVPYYYYQIPIEWNNDQETLEIFLFDSNKKKNSGNKKNNRIIFCIHTHELGQLKIDLKLEEKNLDINIGVEEKEKMNFINTKVKKLKNYLEPLDFNVRNIQCFVDNKKSFQYVEDLLDMPTKFDAKV